MQRRRFVVGGGVVPTGLVYDSFEAGLGAHRVEWSGAIDNRWDVFLNSSTAPITMIFEAYCQTG